MKNLKSRFGSNTTVNWFFILWLVAAFCFLLSNQGICQISPAAPAPLVIDLKSHWNDQIPLENPH
jgi:bacteriorhodopsin